MFSYTKVSQISRKLMKGVYRISHGIASYPRGYRLSKHGSRRTGSSPWPSMVLDIENRGVRRYDICIER